MLRRVAAIALLGLVVVMLAGCATRVNTPGRSSAATAESATSVIVRPLAQNRASDVALAKSLIVASDPTGQLTTASLSIGDSSQAVVDWMNVHHTRPYRALTLWAPIHAGAGTSATPARSVIYDLIQSTRDDSLQIQTVTNSSE